VLLLRATTTRCPVKHPTNHPPNPPQELAVKEERFEDAAQFQEHIVHEMTHNRCGRSGCAGCRRGSVCCGQLLLAPHLRDAVGIWGCSTGPCAHTDVCVECKAQCGSPTANVPSRGAQQLLLLC
jgi:hypothetical protein